MRTRPLIQARRLLLVLSLASSACSSHPKKLTSLDQAGSQWSITVDRAVPDPVRAARVKQLGQQLAELQRSMAQELAGFDAEAFAVGSEYGATAQDAQRVIHGYQAQRRESFARFRDLVFAIRAEVTESEWKDLIE